MGKRQHPGYYEIREVAQTFNVTTATIRFWIKKYNLTPQKTIGGFNRFSEADVQQIRNIIIKRYGIGGTINE